MTDSKSNIEFIANKLGIDKQFIKSNAATGEIFYEISGNTDKRPEIPNQLTTELLQNFHLEFKHCIFKQEVFINNCNISKDISFLDCIFKERISFIEVTFKEKVDFTFITFEKGIDFNRTIFKKEVNFILATFKEEINFNRAIFGEKVKFIGTTFKKEVNFILATFKEEINFNRAIFGENVYFNNSHFCKYADFHECEFEKIACFYGVSFDNPPNFFQAIFKGNLNLVNAKLNFDFKNMQEKIQEEFKSLKNETERKSKANIANDFRDSFRIFKNALIKENNLLDASNFHRVELYCKEIELENKQPQKFSKDWIDKWVLVFYRILCDHHTNLISNLKWLVWLIALYSILLGKLPLFIWFPCLMLFICLAPLVYFLKDKNGIFVSQIFSVVIILCVIFEEPKIIFGVVELFSNGLNWWQKFITAVYTILMALVLFSLQKTARKNSIVPS